VTKKRVSICEIGKRDAEIQTDLIRVLKEMIAQNDDKYPGIERWFETKVLSGIKSGERIGYVAFENEKPIAAAVLKLGESTKLCHLRIDENHQDQDLGQIFFIRMTLAALRYANNIHFTLPESLWQMKAGFFKSFGFSDTARTLRQYRNDDIELVCSASVKTVWSAVVRKLPHLLERFYTEEYSSDSNVLMSVKSHFAERIVSGEKSVELRKQFHSKWEGHEAILYATKPTGSFVGKATICNVTHGSPTDIWARFGSRIGCSKRDFDTYVGATQEVAAVELDNVVRFENIVPLRQMADLLQQRLTPPQSYLELSFKKNRNMVTAVCLAELLQGRF
jgi:predicted transcriptional regulator